MDHSKCEEDKYDAQEIDDAKFFSFAEKIESQFLTQEKCGNDENHELEVNFASQTPEKPNCPRGVNFKEGEIELPQRYKIMTQLFNSMTCSLRLLNIGHKVPTFENICTQVEILAKMKFCRGQLAQMKYILPEAIQIDSIRVHDKVSLFMKMDMKIELSLDVVDGHHEHTSFIALSQLFSSRLINFFLTHPEACDVPEAALLDRTGGDLQVTTLQDSLTKNLASPSPRQQLALDCSVEDGPATTTKLSCSSHCSNQHKQTTRTTEFSGPCDKVSYFSVLNVTNIKQEPKAPCQPVGHHFSVGSTASCESPVWKKTLSPPVDHLATQTPVQFTPARAITIPRSDDKLRAGQKLLVSSYKPAKRTLDFSFVEDVSQFPASSSTSQENNGGVLDLEQKAPLLDPRVSLHIAEVVACINRVFEVVNYSAMTKEELVHKLVTNSLDYDGRGEVEEDIEILEKMVPRWIWTTVAPGGVVLYKVKKISDLDSVLQDLHREMKPGVL